MGKTLYEYEGEEEFLKWFGKLLDYPDKVQIAYDLDVAIKQLIQIKDKNHKRKVKNLLERLVQRNPKYYEAKRKWEKLSK